ncbi:MAG: signal peptidase II [Saccharofermentans sp.]|nr:signal peptidase II [Saccharofermentans sp.]
MSRIKYPSVLFILFSIVLILIDQMSKAFIVKNYDLYRGVAIINNFLSFYHVHNTGSAFSFLADKEWGIYVLTAVSSLLALGVLYLMIKVSMRRDFLTAGSLMLLFSGAVGNLIDRYRLHYVVDFIRFDFGSYTFPIFNIADICAVLGTILIICILLFLPKRIDNLW